MLTIDINKEKPLDFEIQLSGIVADKLRAFLRMPIGGVEYGFEGTLSPEKISFILPVLKNITNEKLKNGDIIDVRMDVFGDDHYLNPWNGKINIKIPIEVSVKVVDGESIETEGDHKPFIGIKTLSQEQVEQHKKPKKTLKIIEEKGVIKPKKDIKVLKEQLTRDHLIKYMYQNGTKSETVQEAILLEIMNRVGEDNYQILKELVKIYKKDKKNG